MDELQKLRNESLAAAEREIALRTAAERVFELDGPLGSEEVPVPRLVGVTSFGRPGADGAIFSLGDWEVNLERAEILDREVRIWVALLALAARRGVMSIEIGSRELAGAAGESWGGATGKRIEASLEALRRVELRIKRDGKLIFDGALLGAFWSLDGGGWGIALVEKTNVILAGFCRAGADWMHLGAPARKIASYVLCCSRKQKSIRRKKLIHLLGWENRPTKETNRDLRTIMPMIEPISGIEINSSSIGRDGKLTWRWRKR